MASMPAVWTSPGGSSPLRRSTLRTSTPTVCGAACTKRAKTALRNGVAPRTAPVASLLRAAAAFGRTLDQDFEGRAGEVFAGRLQGFAQEQETPRHGL